jgi:hypothetical protein
MEFFFFKAKDQAIVDLTNQLHDCKMVGMGRRTQATQTDRTGESIGDALEAYTSQNKFLNEELLEMNHLLQESVHREDKLLVYVLSTLCVCFYISRDRSHYVALGGSIYCIYINMSCVHI